MSILRKLFGKKPSAPTSNNQVQRHILPPELWDDPKLGKFLRTIGASPDDKSNLIPTEAEEVERIDASRNALEERTNAFALKLRTETGGDCNVIPFFLLGDDCWKGEAGILLEHHLRLLPYDEWNIAYFAADQETSQRCDIPLHPGRLPDLEQWGVRLMSEIKQGLDNARGATLAKNLEEIKRYNAAVNTARSDVFAVAKHMHNTLLKQFKADRDIGAS